MCVCVDLRSIVCLFLQLKVEGRIFDTSWLLLLVLFVCFSPLRLPIHSFNLYFVLIFFLLKRECALWWRSFSGGIFAEFAGFFPLHFQKLKLKRRRFKTDVNQTDEMEYINHLNDSPVFRCKVSIPTIFMPRVFVCLYLIVIDRWGTFFFILCFFFKTEPTNDRSHVGMEWLSGQQQN